MELHSFSEAFEAALKDGSRIRRNWWGSDTYLRISWTTVRLLHLHEWGEELLEEVGEGGEAFSLSDVKAEDWEILPFAKESGKIYF